MKEWIPQKRGPFFKRTISSSNHWFSGDMLVSGGVAPEKWCLGEDPCLWGLSNSRGLFSVELQGCIISQFGLPTLEKKKRHLGSVGFSEQKVSSFLRVYVRVDWHGKCINLKKMRGKISYTIRCTQIKNMASYLFAKRVREEKPKVMANEPRKNPLTVPLYWLFYRDPYHGLSQSLCNWVV